MGVVTVSLGSRVSEWMQRPRRRYSDVVSWSTQGLLAFPIVCLCVTIGWLTGGPRPKSHILLLIFSGVALLQLAFLIVWLRRPVQVRERPERPRPAPPTIMRAPRCVARAVENVVTVEEDAV